MTDQDQQAIPSEDGEAKPVRRPPRRVSREFVLQGLYQWRVGGMDVASVEAHMQDAPGFDKADRNFFINLLRGTIARELELTQLAAAYVDRNFADLSPIEACILLLGAFELQQHPETPYRVIINEAIELAKTFGGTDGHRYVNGVLDKLAAQLRPEEVEARKQKR